MAVRVVMEKGWQEKMRPHIDDFLDDIADDVAMDAIRFAPKVTGQLKGSIRVHRIVTVGGGLRIGRRVRAHAPYSAYVELGTTHHIILPRIKKALWWPGLIRPVKKVNHPGATPNPFLRPALYKERVS